MRNLESPPPPRTVSRGRYRLESHVFPRAPRWDRAAVLSRLEARHNSLSSRLASVAAGSYPFTLTGASESLTRRASRTLQAQGPPDFSGTLSPTSATLSVGHPPN